MHRIDSNLIRYGVVLFLQLKEKDVWNKRFKSKLSSLYKEIRTINHMQGVRLSPQYRFCVSWRRAIY